MEEKVFVQNQASNAAVHSSIFVIGWQIQSNGSQDITVANLTPTYDSQSNAEFTQVTGTLLADELANTGVVTRSDFFGNYVVVESSGSDLRIVASNLVASIRALGDNWYAVLVTPRSEALFQQILSDSRASS